MILLDTHAVIWFAFGEVTLGPHSKAMAEAALDDRQLGVSVITFWEIALLMAKRRLAMVTPASDLRQRLLSAGVTELPLTGDIAILAVELPGLHGDPADRFIAASAIRHDATLITADARLLGWNHSVKRHDARQ